MPDRVDNHTDELDPDPGVTRARSKAKAKAPPSLEERRRDLLRAVLEELAESDYGGLSYELVASRAGVAKTTVYRQWPTKPELVAAALDVCAAGTTLEASTGSLREDLVVIGRRMREFATSVEGRGLIRLGILDHPEPELAKIAQRMERRYHAKLTKVLGAAVKRGELSPDVDLRLLVDLLGGAIHVRLFVKKASVEDAVIERIVDMLLRGVATDRRTITSRS